MNDIVLKLNSDDAKLIKEYFRVYDYDANPDLNDYLLMEKIFHLILISENYEYDDPSSYMRILNFITSKLYIYDEMYCLVEKNINNEDIQPHYSIRMKNFGINVKIRKQLFPYQQHPIFIRLSDHKIHTNDQLHPNNVIFYHEIETILADFQDNLQVERG